MPVKRSSTDYSAQTIDPSASASQKKTKLSSIQTAQASSSGASQQNTSMSSVASTRHLEYPALAPIFTGFHQATPLEKQTQGQIHQIKPGLMIGHLVDDQNHVMYFVRENMDVSRANTWSKMRDSFQNAAACLATSLKDEFDAKVNFKTVNETKLDRFFNIEDEVDTIGEISRQLNITKDNANPKVFHLASMAVGASVFYPHAEKYETRHVSYISSEPIFDFAFQQNNKCTQVFDQQLQEMKYTTEITGHISMAVSSGTKGECTEHRGIFKTPLSILNNHRGYFKSKDISVGGLSMALHLFGMQCAKQEGIRYFTISPADMMHAIFFKTMYSDIKKNRIAVGKDDIEANGWTSHIRDVGDQEQPIVCDLKYVKNKLFDIKPSSSSA